MRFQLSAEEVATAIAQWVVSTNALGGGNFQCKVVMSYTDRTATVDVTPLLLDLITPSGHNPPTVEATLSSAHPTEVAHDDHGGSGEHAEEEAAPEKLPPTQDG